MGSSFSLRLRRDREQERGGTGAQAQGESLDLLERERISRLADELDDPKLKRIFEEWIQVSVRRDRERARRGGKRCKTCGVHHEEEGDVCYYCKLERT